MSLENSKSPVISIYQPLVPEQIRVLKVLRAPGTEVIKCLLLRATIVTVEGVRLDEEWHERNVIQYTALSYSWGRPEADSHVICNGHKFPVTSHLRSALQAFRSDREDRYLWTDAFCINQEDLFEKGGQVEKMCQLYQKAQGVFCWLGNAEDKYHYLLDVLMQLKEHAVVSSSTRLSAMDALCQGLYPLDVLEEDSYADLPILHRKRLDETLHYGKQSASNLTELAAFAVDFVIDCDWFKRTWIRQEVFAARQLQAVCGTYHFDFKDLYKLVRYANSESKSLLPYEAMMSPLYKPSQTEEDDDVDDDDEKSITDTFFHGLEILDSTLRKSTSFIDLILSNAAGFLVTNDLDRIYALRGMAENSIAQENRLVPVVDYTRSFLELSADLIKRQMHQNGTCQMLSIVERRKDDISEDWPSWLIDFRKIEPRVFLYPEIIPPIKKRSDEWLRRSLLPGEIPKLRLSGIVIGVVGLEADKSSIRWSDFFSPNYAQDKRGLRGHKVYGTRKEYDRTMLMKRMRYKCSAFLRTYDSENWNLMSDETDETPEQTGNMITVYNHEMMDEAEVALHNEEMTVEAEWRAISQLDIRTCLPLEMVLTPEVVDEGDIVVSFDEGVTFPEKSSCQWEFGQMSSSMGFIKESGDTLWTLRPSQTEPGAHTFLGPSFVVSALEIAKTKGDKLSRPFKRSLTLLNSSSIASGTLDYAMQDFILV